MNLTLPVLLALAGIALFVTGILGKLKVKDWFDIGTESSVARGALVIFGFGLIGLSYVVYRPEIKADLTDQTVASAASHDQTTETQPIADESAPKVTIITPESNWEITPKLNDGVARIDVSGEIENANMTEDERVFVFTNSEGGLEWAYDEPVKIDSAGTWKSSALYGSSEDEVKPGAPVYIQAVLATQKAVDAPKKNKKEKLIGELDDIDGAILSKKVVVYLTAPVQ